MEPKMHCIMPTAFVNDQPAVSLLEIDQKWLVCCRFVAIHFKCMKLLVEQGWSHRFALNKKNFWNIRWILIVLKMFKFWTSLNVNANFLTYLLKTVPFAFRLHAVRESFQESCCHQSWVLKAGVCHRVRRVPLQSNEWLVGLVSTVWAPWSH